MGLDSIAGSLIGTAVADALGLPYEGLSPRRARKLLGPPTQHRLVFRRGMVSDDTEHSRMVAQALIASELQPDPFQFQLGRRLRWWLAGVPAGIGFATLKACLKLWLGFSPSQSGVASAGNGPAMRAAIVGASLDDLDHIQSIVHASTVITHTDPAAEDAALAVAIAAFQSRSRSASVIDHYLQTIHDVLREKSHPLLERIEHAAESVRSGHSTDEFARELGCLKGVTGYSLNTVPVAIHAWMRSPLDYESAVRAVILCGGDTDTTAAIVGGIVGAATGEDGIPNAWIDGLVEWPWTVSKMRELAKQLDDVANHSLHSAPISRSPIYVLMRNKLFALIVVVHALRRLAPPY